MKKYKILISLTGDNTNHWKNQLKEINNLKINEIALFLECYSYNERKKIYLSLKKSCVKSIPLIHIRNDMSKKELIYLEKTYKPVCYTIHESSFRYLGGWNGFYPKLYLELNYDNKIPKNVQIEKIGGFCVDISHFQSAKKRKSREYYYTIKHRKNKFLFLCNHINGYDPKNKRDIHTITSLRDFNYLKKIPGFIFGEIMAIETENSIEEQLKFREHIIRILK